MENIKIAITGTPGVGKTTISKKLAEKLGFRHIDITEVVKEYKLYSEKDEEMDSYVIDFDKLREFLYGLDNVILDGHVSHLLDVDYIVVLRCNPEVIKKRLEERRYKQKKVMENVEAEILDVCLAESEGIVYEIDATGRDVDDIVDEIIDAIKNKRVRKGIIDWTEKYFYLLE
ncbi:Adenylate kinase [Methanotorris formicicus Mc-S-70]|uniref:Putative adenylate kinase n=1 Tax=Methanotorris formicicus Mc-S-70 TaxID=647171 RepID=H1KX50_9EURY|nr:Adenylate kinase [Methanotorris formicicus Mc-S-70]